MEKRRLGKSDLLASPMGLGCYAIGGTFRVETGQQWGWSGVDDQESIRALHAGIDAGVNFMDTAQAYGCGHSEAVIGKAIKGKREQVILATKFGKVIDATAKQVKGSSIEPAYLRQSCDDSLRRFGVETIDLFQWHESSGSVEDLPGLVETLEALVSEGKIRWYGWSTDDPERVRAAVDAPHFLAVQHRMHAFDDHSGEMLDVCNQFDLASIIRGPLAMGILTGKFSAETRFHQDDVRHSLGIDFSQGWGARMLARVAAVREIFCSGGRTPVQGALAWIWGRSEISIPIPGFKTATQVAENARAMDFGPLDPGEMAQIAAILADFKEKEY